MTAPGPHDPPTTRRAAREPRDDSGAPERREADAEFGATAVTWDDLPDWVEDASPALVPARHRSNFVPATSAIRPRSPTLRPRRTAPPRRAPGESPTGLTRRELRAREPQPGRTGTRRGPRGRARTRPAREPSTATGPTRREVRTTELLESEVTPARHLRARGRHGSGGIRLVAAAALLIGGTMAVTAAVTTPLKTAATQTVDEPEPDPVPLPEAVAAIPAPSSSAVPALVDVCADPEFVAALGAGDDAKALAARRWRRAVPGRRRRGSGGLRPPRRPRARLGRCVNKTRPYDPIDYRPAPLVRAGGVRNISGGSLRADAAAALTAMVAAARAAGAGEIALDSGYRSYRDAAVDLRRVRCRPRGVRRPTLSARGPATASTSPDSPPTSWRARAAACGLESFGGTAQQQWVAAHSWEFGWIVRYEDGLHRGRPGTQPEPWHLRYVGTELARAYHDGGWHTLEQFLGMPAAPDYVG